VWDWDMTLAFFFVLFCPFLFCFVLMEVESVELGHDPDCAVFFCLFVCLFVFLWR